VNSSPGGSPAARRRYLFLQGPIGPFFGQAGVALEKAGHTVHRINFNGGDKRGWVLPGAVDYRGDRESWPAYLAEKLQAWSITDIILFGDCRPLHRAAISLARQVGVAIHVLEEGYLRPGWITMETGGVNGYSSMPHDPAWYLREGHAVPEIGTYPGAGDGFVLRAIYDIQYNLGIASWMLRFRKYRTHKPWHPSSEYRAGFWRFFRKPAMKRRAARIVQDVLAKGSPFYVFPLQLDADSQLRFHSPFGGMTAAIRAVVESFSRSAPADALLAVTEHPLDQGVIDLRAEVESCAAKFGVSDRVHFLQCGTPEALVAGCRGLITVNSTLGLSALSEGRRVIALGRAIYALPGMTFQGGLDAFWNGQDAPDENLVAAFRRVIADRTQIRGGFFGEANRALALDGMMRRLDRFVADLVIVPGQALDLGDAPHVEPSNPLSTSVEFDDGVLAGETDRPLLAG
jgi:capsular polysaccharide export protein